MSPQWLVGILALFFLVTLVATSPVVQVNDEEDKKDTGVKKRGFGTVGGHAGQCLQDYYTFVRNCIELFCVPDNSGGYNIIPTRSQMCRDDNDRCHNVGAKFARTTEGSYHSICYCRQDGVHCTANPAVRLGECLHDYYQFVKDCVMYQCIPNSSGGYDIIQSGSQMCKDNTGKCYKVGAKLTRTIEGHYYSNCICLRQGQVRCTADYPCVHDNFRFVKDCVTYECIPKESGGHDITPTDSQMCKDDTGICYNVRFGLATTINGHYYRNCVCQKDGQFQCVEKTPCLHDYYQFVQDCINYRCFPNNSGGYNITQTGTQKCKDDNGRCYNVGANLARTINGHYYRNCVCQTKGKVQCTG